MSGLQDIGKLHFGWLYRNECNTKCVSFSVKELAGISRDPVSDILIASSSVWLVCVCYYSSSALLNACS